ncbi:MAG: hypothetical protein N2512_03070, partial [Armatimonadetes bacterium]|nr:hypothetical protein [Armatimonadota bacterium]
MARWIRVSTVSYTPVEAGENFLERQREKLAQLAELAATARPKPDLVLFPEHCNVSGLPTMEAQMEAAEPVPGPTTERLSEVAVKHNMYIVVPMPTRDG